MLESPVDVLIAEPPAEIVQVVWFAGVKGTTRAMVV